MILKDGSEITRLDFGSDSFSSRDKVENFLNKNSFNPIDDLPGETESAGFCAIFDKDEPPYPEMIGGLYCVGWRTDKRKADKQQAKRKLELEEKRNGGSYEKKKKRERLEEIVMEMTSRAIPVPAIIPVFIDPAGSIYFAGSMKKFETGPMDRFGSFSAEISETCGIEPEIMGWFLENLWNASEEGVDNFTPKSMKGENSASSSDDSVDLAFCRAMGKRCNRGTLVLENGTEVSIGGNSLDSFKITFNIDGMKDMEDADALEVQLPLIVESSNNLRKMFGDFSSNAMSEEKIAENLAAMAKNAIQ